MSKTISEQIEDIKSNMCDNYCKYSNAPTPEGKSENWLFEDDDSPCKTCPLCEL